MKSKGHGTAEQPVAAPKGWPNAFIDSVRRYLREHGPWIGELGLRRNLSALIDTHCPLVKHKRAAIIVLSGQTDYWKRRALNAEEVLKDHNIPTRTPRSIL